MAVKVVRVLVVLAAVGIGVAVRLAYSTASPEPSSTVTVETVRRIGATGMLHFGRPGTDIVGNNHVWFIRPWGDPDVALGEVDAHTRIRTLTLPTEFHAPDVFAGWRGSVVTVVADVRYRNGVPVHTEDIRVFLHGGAVMSVGVALQHIVVTSEMLHAADQFLTPTRSEERILGTLNEYGRTLLAAHLAKVRELHSVSEQAELLEGREPPPTVEEMKLLTRRLRVLRAEVAALFAELRVVAFRTSPEVADNDVVIFRSGWRIVASTRAIIRDEERSDTATALWFRNDIAFD